LLKWLLPAMTPVQFVFIHGAVRKTGHFVGYAVLSLLFYRSWWTTLRARSGTAALSWAAMLRAWMWRAAVLALLGTLVIAAADEFHQSFAPGRGASIHDVALDGLGGLGVQCWMLAFSSSMAVGESKRRNRGKPNLTSA
jgi:VanZ family protein